MNFKHGIRMEYNSPASLHHQQRSRSPGCCGWLFKSSLTGAGAYCGGPATGHTAWFCYCY